jgi:hypothetical protein
MGWRGGGESGAIIAASCGQKQNMTRLLIPLLMLLSMAAAGAVPAVHLDLSPRICVLGKGQERCAARVQAQWHSPEPLSLCLVILQHPEIQHCWERYAEGSYEVTLEFSADLVVQLRDPQLRQTLASETLRIIREAQQFRHRHRQPWSLFE